MSATVETIGANSRRPIDGGAISTRRFAVRGVASPDAADAAVVAYLQNQLGFTLSLNGLELSDIASEEQIKDVYFSTATWRTFSRSTPLALGDTEFSFQISTNPVEIKVPISVSVYASATAGAFSPQLINDVGDGAEPAGVQVFEPVYEESKTKIIATSALTTSFRNALKQTVGKVNSSAFQGWQPGEVLLTGVSGTRRGAKDSELSFRWQVRENETNMVVAGVSGIQKDGWDYLWPRAELRGGETAPVYKEITHVCVARVFKRRNFSVLGI